jgi:hypothetical protein
MRILPSFIDSIAPADRLRFAEATDNVTVAALDLPALAEQRLQDIMAEGCCDEADGPLQRVLSSIILLGGRWVLVSLTLP